MSEHQHPEWFKLLDGFVSAELPASERGAWEAAVSAVPDTYDWTAAFYRVSAALLRLHNGNVSDVIALCERGADDENIDDELKALWIFLLRQKGIRSRSAELSMLAAEQAALASPDVHVDMIRLITDEMWSAAYDAAATAAGWPDPPAWTPADTMRAHNAAFCRVLDAIVAALAPRT